jgi:hypothetical protein
MPLIEVIEALKILAEGLKNSEFRIQNSESLSFKRKLIKKK